MTLESVAGRLAESVSWLYHQRQWAAWELELVGLAAMVLLLLVVRRRRKVSSPAGRQQLAKQQQTVGSGLAAGTAGSRQAGEVGVNHVAYASKRDGKRMRWGQTAREMRSFGALVEDLQVEVSRYKAAEENFKQQLASLKAANERLQRELAAKGVQHADLTNTIPLARFGRPQDRMPAQ